MGRKNKNKRKKSDNSENNDSVCKAGRFTDSPSDNVCVSRLLSQTNSVLFSDNDAPVAPLSNSFDQDSGGDSGGESDPEPGLTTLKAPDKSDPAPTHTSTMDTTNSQSNIQSAAKTSPTNADILSYLEKINDRLGSVEKKLEKIDSLEKKVCSFEKEFSKLWTSLQDFNRKTDEKLGAVEEKVESVSFSLGMASDKVVQLEKEKDLLKDEVVYLQSQSMRNNLVFVNIEESARGVTEDCEAKLRDFLATKMKIAQDIVDRLSFERVHRMGQRVDNKSRKMIAKFTLFKERELVRRQWKSLEGTNYYIHEQYPKEVVEKRRRLLPKLKEARDNNKRAWLSYDTLYIDGKPVRDINR